MPGFRALVIGLDAPLIDFCQRHRIARLALSGSAARSDFGPDSDVDVLVECQPGHVPGLDILGMKRELSGLLQGVGWTWSPPSSSTCASWSRSCRRPNRSMSPRDLVYVGHMLDQS